MPRTTAFLKSDQKIYFSQGEHPIARLIQAVYDFKPEHARRILRSRIYSDALPSEMELGMVKVAAKRLSAPCEIPETAREWVELEAEPPPPLLDLASLPQEALHYLEQRQFMRAALAIAERIPRKEKLYETDRRVAALLVSRDERVLAAAVNSNARNRTRHAEMNLVQAFLASGNAAIPTGARIYVTLKCCKMCAAAIWCAAEDLADFSVFFAQDDPGPNARSTVFTRSSFERKRASRTERELELEIEYQLSP